MIRYPRGAAVALPRHGFRGKLLRKYGLALILAITGTLLAGGLVNLYFSYRDQHAVLVRLEREQAASAAATIQRFVRDIQQQVDWAMPPLGLSPAMASELRRESLNRLPRQSLAVTDATYLDEDGKEQLRISRLEMDVEGSGVDYSQAPEFVEARARGSYFSPVYYRQESEPYMTVAMAERTGGGVTFVRVNLKLIWETVARITIGETGYVYVVDDRGFLLSHPDISLVLEKTNLASFVHVGAALAGVSQEEGNYAVSSSFGGKTVLTANHRIDPPGWFVFVDQPLDEAYRPVYEALARALLLLVWGFGLAVLTSVVLARRMVNPILALQAGASRIADGDLDQRIEVRTGDELEALAEEFNRMSAQLRELYADLEGKVEARTHELALALDEQTASSDVLSAMSRSSFDLTPVLHAILHHCMRLSHADHGFVFRMDGDSFRMEHTVGTPPELQRFLARNPIMRGRGSLTGRVGLACAPVQIVDVLADTEYQAIESQSLAGYRTIVGVPMMREGLCVGVIGMARLHVEEFTEREIKLLTTMADQAVLAVENVRLFEEIAEKSRQLEAASQHKSEFLAHMSHELRTPLNAIIGFSDVLLERMFGPLNEKQDDYLHDIANSGRHLLSLINDVLDLTKVEAGHMELDLRPVFLTEVLESSLAVVRELATRREIALSLLVDPSIDVLDADERKVKQVLLNLLSNAVRFTPPGGRIGVSARQTGAMVQVAVKDSGIGIAPEDQERIFEAFQQAHQPGMPREGTGLGLPLARQFVELHGGKLWVGSALGEGSTFTFTLPLGRQANPQQVSGGLVDGDPKNGVNDDAATRLEGAGQRSGWPGR